MKYATRFLLSAFLAVIMGELLFASNACSSGRKDYNALVLLDCIENSAMNKVIEEITSKGADVIHVFPPNAFFVYLPDTISLKLKGKEKIKAIYKDIIDVSALSEIKRYDKTAEIAARVWNYTSEERKAMRKIPFPRPGPILNDVRIIPPSQFQKDLCVPFSKRSETLGENSLLEIGRTLEVSSQSSGSLGDYLLGGSPSGDPPLGVGFYNTSEYMIGNPHKSSNIAVGIILPESNGGIDPSTEDWVYPDSLSLIVTKIVDACNWWATIAPGGIYLKFTYEYYYAAPTKYEPINHPSSDEGLWISEVIDYVHPSSYTDYINKVI